MSDARPPIESNDDRMRYLAGVLVEMTETLRVAVDAAAALSPSERAPALRRVIATSNAVRTAAYNLTRAAGTELEALEEEP